MNPNLLPGLRAIVNKTPLSQDEGVAVFEAWNAAANREWKIVGADLLLCLFLGTVGIVYDVFLLKLISGVAATLSVWFFQSRIMGLYMDDGEDWAEKELERISK